MLFSRKISTNVLFKDEILSINIQYQILILFYQNYAYILTSVSYNVLLSHIDRIYADHRLGKADKRVLEFLQGVEKRPVDVWNAKVVKNKNHLHSTLKKLEELGYLIKREDPSHRNRYLYTASYYTPVPRAVGWQRYLLESQMAKYRNAAKLGLHLYYYCVDHLEGHRNRCQSLAEVLGIQNFVENILELSRTASSEESIELIRKVDTKIREYHDNIVSAAFSLTSWISVSLRLKRNQVSETNPNRRILDELRVLTDEIWVTEYSKTCLDLWFSRNRLDNKYEQELVNRNGELFLHILKRYVTTFGTQHTQSDLLRHFFEEKIPLNDDRFQERAERILIRRTGKINVISGSGAFQNIIKQKKIKAKTNQQLKGGIRFNLTVNTPESNIVPLIEVMTWSSREIKNQGWREIARNLEKRFESYEYPEKEVQVYCNAPQKEGTYYLIYAFAEETDGEYVSSMTNWRINYPVWNDGCDIADMTESQIKKIQKDGYIETFWLKEDGYAPTHLAACAITIEVT